jgi:hypothetical protein
LPLSPCLILGALGILFAFGFLLVCFLARSYARIYEMYSKNRMYVVRLRALMELVKVLDTCEDKDLKHECRIKLIDVLSEVLKGKTMVD